MSSLFKALEQFRDEVVSEARRQLAAKGKNASGKLSDSIQGEVKQMPNSIGIYFEMEDYGNFQDKGVDGLQVKHGAPYSFRKGFPSRSMLASLDKWVIKRGIAPRKASGQFVTRQGLKFAIAKTIFKKGIKPSLFFTKPFEEAFKKLPDDLIQKYGLDMEQDLLKILEENLRR